MDWNLTFTIDVYFPCVVTKIIHGILACCYSRLFEMFFISVSGTLGCSDLQWLVAMLVFITFSCLPL